MTPSTRHRKAAPAANFKDCVMTDHTSTRWGASPSGVKMAGYSQPWAIYQVGFPNLIAGCFGDVKGGAETAEANAAFIVKAVNAHDELVAALKQAEGWLMGWASADAQFAVIRAALAKATP